MQFANLRDWPLRPVRAVASWNADLARLDADRPSSKRRLLDLGVLAALGLGIVALVVWLARWQTLSAHPRAFTAALLAQLALYGAAAGWVLWRKPPARWALAVIVLVALGARLAFVAQTPSASDDVYRYVWDGRVQAQGLNPYRYAPEDPALALLRDDTIYPHINRKQAHTIYPPVAQAVFRGLYALHPNSVTWTKLAFSGIDLVSIAIIAGLLMRLGLRPERVLLYAWHPLLILEIGHSGHLDGVVICLLALAVRARLQGRAGAAGALLAAAALVKFYALAALPALLFRELRRDIRTFGALSVTVLLAYLPFLSVGTGVFGYLGGYAREEGLASGGRFYLLGRSRQLLEAVPGVTWLFGGLPIGDARLYQGAVLLTLGGLALWCWRARLNEPREIITRAALLFATLLALTTPAYPWYTLLLLAFAPALGGRVLLPAVTIVSLAGFLYLQWWWPGQPRWPLDLFYGAGTVSLALVASWTLVMKLARVWPGGHRPPPPWQLGAARRGAAHAAPVGLAAWRTRIDADGSHRAQSGAPTESPSLFDRFPWLYAFCRERLFRDHTRLIAAGLWPSGAPGVGDELLEIGCGPGFYARRFAQQHAALCVSGIDRSQAQLCHARARAQAGQLANCCFEHGDALRLPRAAGVVDAVVVSRLFTVLPERELALAELQRVLRDGGRCFIAEPRSQFWTALPLRALWLLASVTSALRRQPARYREPRRATVLSAAEFGALIDGQPWRRARVWRDRQYHYALCVKADRSAVPEQALAAD